MRDAAKLSDTSMDVVAQGMQRFAAAVVQAQAGTGKQAEALKALGFNAAAFATQFKTTDQALVAVAQRLSQYSDGLGKTAIEQALLGKTGAQMGAFLQELAQDGTNGVKVTTEQALAARRLGDAITALRIQLDDLLNRIGVALVPVLTAAVKGIDTFKDIAIAAAVAFGGWPLLLNGIAAAITLYKDAAISAALATEVLGQQASVAGTLLGGIVAPAELAAGALSALKASAALLFAGFAGWEIGKWLSDQFLVVRQVGLTMVDSLATGWEYVKYAAGVAWEGIKLVFSQSVENMRQEFGGFIKFLGDGFSHVPGAGGLATSLQSFGAAIAGPSGAALATFKANFAQLGVEFDTNRAKIHDVTTDMMAMNIVTEAGSAAADKAHKQPPPVPHGTTQGRRTPPKHSMPTRRRSKACRPRTATPSPRSRARRWPTRRRTSSASTTAGWSTSSSITPRRRRCSAPPWRCRRRSSSSRSPTRGRW